MTEPERERVDFFSPSAESNGTRIAFSSDLRLEQGLLEPGLPAAAELWSTEFRVLDLLEPEAADLLLPPAGETPDCPGCPPAWDLASDSLVYSTWLNPVSDIGRPPDRFVVHPVGGSPVSTIWGPRRLEISAVFGSHALGFQDHFVLDPFPPSLYLADLGTAAATHLFLQRESQVVACTAASNDPCAALDTSYTTDARLSPSLKAVMAVHAEPDLDPDNGVNRRHHGDIYFADLAGIGSASRPITRLHDAGGQALYPVLSPDEQWVAFQHHGDGHVYVIRFDATEQTQRYRVSAEAKGRLGLTWLPTLLLPE
jgi:hypothetical protein